MGNTQNLYTEQEIWNRILNETTGTLSFSAANSSPTPIHKNSIDGALNKAFDATNNILTTV